MVKNLWASAALFPMLTFLTLLVAFDVDAQTKFRASYAGTTGYHLPIWVQKQENLDKKYGLDMELLLIGGGARVIQALLGGDLQLTHSGASTVARAGIAGADLVIIATVVNQITWKIVTRKEIKVPADLLGKKVAIAARGGSSELGLQLAFKHWGLDFSKLVILSLGPTPNRIAALREGVVDATVLSYPELLMATQMGYPVLADLRQFAQMTDTSVVLGRSTLEKQRPILKRFLQGYVEAIALLKRRPEVAYRALTRYTGNSDRAALEQTYRFYAESMAEIPRTAPNGWRNLIATFGKNEKEMARLLDMSLLDELQREGFFDR
ncbi:MAG TPA: ABC transporter substrate-binding protein, partial [Candidatus Binatia bacterium]